VEKRAARDAVVRETVKRAIELSNIILSTSKTKYTSIRFRSLMSYAYVSLVKGEREIRRIKAKLGYIKIPQSVFSWAAYWLLEKELKKVYGRSVKFVVRRRKKYVVLRRTKSALKKINEKQASLSK